MSQNLIIPMIQTLTGSDDNDSLFGSDDNDRILGNAGNDSYSNGELQKDPRLMSVWASRVPALRIRDRTQIFPILFQQVISMNTDWCFELVVFILLPGFQV
ncbi:MAG: hypothetical protein GDA38_08465 [Hormoscilla sp. SP12CHS1]|nr:hypothetical protein [Hormoscilla sp. SP12CHS1]